MWLSVLIVVSVILAFTVLPRRKSFKGKLPPDYPGAWPIIGHAYLLASIPFFEFSEKISKASETSGGVIGYKLGSHHVYLICDPEDSLTVVNACLGKGFFYDFIKPALGEGLFTAKCDDDKLVKSVLKAIPDGVRKEGVVPESVLRERYHLMEQTALSVALVEQDGSSMPVYIVSWLQSLFLFMKPPGIAQKDIDKPVKEQKELEDLDTFDILNLARYWVEKGCFKTALSYVDSLKGASRVAADQWLKDATNHLEIRQAAEAIMAHATAMSLQFV